MPVLLLVFVLLATAAVVTAGIVLTLRAFKEDKPPAETTRPRAAMNHAHDVATTATLKHFFEGRTCHVCHRTIPVVHLGDPRPGLFNPRTHAALEWNEIPSENLAATLEAHVPVCASCLVAESFRQKFPDLVVDRPAHSH